MNLVIIEIGDKQIELKFGYGVLRRLSEKWNIPSIQGVFERFGAFQNKDQVEIGFEQLNLFGDLVWAGAATGGHEIDPDDAVTVLMHDPEKMGEIMIAFMSSLPKPTEEQKKTIVQKKK